MSSLEAFLVLVFAMFCVCSIVFYFKVCDMIHVFNEVLKYVKKDPVIDVDVKEVNKK